MATLKQERQEVKEVDTPQAQPQTLMDLLLADPRSKDPKNMGCIVFAMREKSGRGVKDGNKH